MKLNVQYDLVNVYMCVSVLKKVDITLLTGLFLGGTVTVVINLLSYTHIFFNK